MSGVCKALLALMTDDLLAKVDAQDQLEWFKKQGAELNHKNPVLSLVQRNHRCWKLEGAACKVVTDLEGHVDHEGFPGRVDRLLGRRA